MLPTFLGLGSARCASTWLYNNLCQHPQILMTFEKEISFFGKECLDQNLKWYEQSFRPTPGRESATIRGDISPWYTRLSRQNVRAVHRVLPHAKIILIVRNPIERAWSHAVMELSRHRRRDLSRVPQWRWVSHFDRLRQWWYGDYDRTLRNWSEFYSPAQIHVDLYDRVCSDPAGMMRGVLAHINADANWMPPADSLHHRTWTIGEVTAGRSDGLQLPDSLRWLLARQWLEPTQRLNERLDGQVDHWVKQMQEILATPAPASWRMLRTAQRTILRWPKRVGYSAFHLVREMRLAQSYKRIAAEMEHRKLVQPPIYSPIPAGLGIFSRNVQKDPTAAQKL